MKTGENHSLEIDVCSKDHYGAALWLAIDAPNMRARRGQLTALLAAQNQARIDFEGLFIARRAKRIAGAIWISSQAGKIASLYGLGLISSEEDNVAAALIERGVQFAESRGLSLIQALIGPSQPAKLRHLQQSGFQQVTTIWQLAAAVSHERSTITPCPEIKFVAVQDPSSPDFSGCVERTYQDSRDCPELDRLRETKDVLKGYSATCGNDHRHWYIVKKGDSDAGVVILAHHPEAQQLELIYFGLFREFRGQGMGRTILDFVMTSAAKLGCDRVVTSFDSRNAPAVTCYHELGFDRADAREFLLRPIPPHAAAVA